MEPTGKKGMSPLEIGGIIVGAIALVGGIYYALKPKAPTKGGKSGTKQPNPQGQTPSGALQIQSAAQTAANAASAATGNSINPGESAAIVYIAPHYPDGSGGTSPSQMIEIRTGAGVIPIGSTVQVDHPNYGVITPVVGNWDSGDGTGSVFLNVPYSNNGGTNSLGNWEDDSTGGTISVVGTATPPAQPVGGTGSADGTMAADAKPSKETHPAMKILKAPKFPFSPNQAALRREAQIAGHQQGLKGVALRTHIATYVGKPKTHSADGGKNPATAYHSGWACAKGGENWNG